MKIKYVALIVSGSIAFSNCEAYEPPTHQELTAAAIQRSVLITDPTVLSDLGLSSNGSFSQFTFGSLSSGLLFVPNASTPPQPGQPDTPFNDLVFGSSYEDNEFKAVALNHFFDPQWHGGAGRPLTLPTAVTPVPIASPDWIIGDRVIPSAQFFAYTQAHSALYNALTAANPSDRAAATGLAFQSLGHVVHHIQDMAQPQHVRNEQHLHGFLLYPDDASAAYEKHTLLIDPNGSWLPNQLSTVWPKYPIPEFENLRQYWSSYNNSSYVGMAEFTSRNYVTFHNPLSLDPSTNLVGPAQDYPLPSAYNKDGTKVIVTTRATTEATVLPAGSRSGSVSFVMADIGDDLPSNTANVGRIIARESALSMIVHQNGVLVRVFASDDPTVWDDNYQVLLPRAVSFSAGIINHFFRARVSFARSFSTNWLIKNPTSLSMVGTWTILTENSSGIRTRLTSFTGTIPSQSSTTISFPEPSASTAKLVVAWSGQIGTELGATAGQVIAYVPPAVTVACLGPYFDNGNSHNFGSASTTATAPNSSATDSILELGSTPGLVQVSYWIIPSYIYPLTYTLYQSLQKSPFGPGTSPNLTTGPLTATISGKYANGNTALAAHPVAGGANTFSFQHNPSGAFTKVTLHEAYPFYAYEDFSAQSKSDVVKQVSCPGQSLDSSKGLRGVNVGVTVPIGVGACGLWTFNINGSTRLSYGTVTVPIGALISVTATLNPAAPGYLTCNGGINPVPGTPYYVDGNGKISYPFPNPILVK